MGFWDGLGLTVAVGAVALGLGVGTGGGVYFCLGSPSVEVIGRRAVVVAVDTGAACTGCSPRSRVHWRRTPSTASATLQP